jgi:hypothetical protein
LLEVEVKLANQREVTRRSVCLEVLGVLAVARFAVFFFAGDLNDQSGSPMPSRNNVPAPAKTGVLKTSAAMMVVSSVFMMSILFG